MSQAVADPRLVNARSAPRKRLRLSWSDPRFRAFFWQVIIVGCVALIVWYLVRNTNQNLAARHIATGFGFLARVAGIPIGETLIPYNPALDTYGRALLIGVLNTLKVSAVGVVLATILGTLIGIGRLSGNWLLAKLTAFYVETLRDIPLLLQLLFWYTILQGLPAPRQAFHIGDAFYLTNRGMKLAVLNWDTAFGWAFLGFLAGIGGTVLWNRHARRRQEATGRPPLVWPVALVLMIGLPVAIWALMGAPFAVDKPVLRGFNFQGGLTLTPEYFALLIGLVTYTASYIAEIVRSGIQAVAKGQWEAAEALGLYRGLVLRKIVLPQALRVIIPPMTSQYLNLTKNSSLAVAIGYQDIVSIANTTLNQTGQAIEGIAIIMAVYLTISLSISLFMNWYNAHIALVER
ncbi:amino acid ABC transporter permease [Rhodopila sp.]|jgi:general L-amino acid transport system permease protein|uniref:amino acid ABC transporter permease n=1 Tax=Rhodopila sp. TaxID=2480087 RepID=UPI002C12422A|nr:amino acid ABC transporter permease [Rhodopila sp.]HVZ08021.1 amino acid ABC transporter permease [Rhodopila sp.]